MQERGTGPRSCRIRRNALPRGHACVYDAAMSLGKGIFLVAVAVLLLLGGSLLVR